MAIDAKLRQAFAGISGILVTPFDGHDELAPERLRPIVDRAVGAGVHVLVANGNTGEFYGLTTAEAERMVHAAAELLDRRVPLLAGVGRSVHDARALARASRAAGAAALTSEPSRARHEASTSRVSAPAPGADHQRGMWRRPCAKQRRRALPSRATMPGPRSC